MSFKKDFNRLQQWASGAARKVESAPLPVPTKETPVDPAFEYGCAGKEAFPSKKAAEASQLYREQQGVPSQGMVAYSCKFCRHWHLGHAKAPSPRS